MAFKKNILKNKSTSTEFKNNSFKNKNNDNGDSDKYVSGAKGYNPDEGYFQSMLKAVQENPNPTSYSKEDRAKHTKELHTSARQKQILDYRKKSLTLKKK